MMTSSSATRESSRSLTRKACDVVGAAASGVSQLPDGPFGGARRYVPDTKARFTQHVTPEGVLVGDALEELARTRANWITAGPHALTCPIEAMS